VTAFLAFSGGLVFKKLHVMTAFRTLCLKNGSWLPEATILSGAFHGVLLQSGAIMVLFAEVA
jgi:hypothetical protein